MSEDALQTWATEFMRESLVVDGHCDTVLHMLEKGFDLSVRNETGHMDIPRMLEAGLDAQFFACFIYPGENPHQDTQTALDMLDALHLAAEQDERLILAGSADDIIEAKKKGCVACLPAIEGGTAILDDIRLLRSFRRLGVRCMTLTWNNSNAIADASDPDQSKFTGTELRGGLTEFGKEVVREMNRIGMIIDLSHCHPDTFRGVLDLSSKPVIVSHSCCHALNPHHRNITDEMLQALARNGGVVGINYFPVFLSSEFAVEAEKTMNLLLADRSALTESCREGGTTLHPPDAGAAKEALGQLRRPPISLIADHIDHAVKVAGIDHVGLGSDFDGIAATPEGLDDVRDVVKIVDALRRRGYSEADIRKILGENFLRVLAAND